ncbi:MAG TPA: hypothetical protein VHL52_14450 [Acidimicrobiia bacterium]|nr:hypothetical protein [Acidimicrobiia bacterium]
MNLRTIGWVQVLRGLRQGNQALLLTGLGLVVFQSMRSKRGERQLVYRKKLPVGSAVVIRHGHRGDPKLEIRRRTVS